jgi:hypothetical protein
MREKEVSMKAQAQIPKGNKQATSPVPTGLLQGKKGPTGMKEESRRKRQMLQRRAINNDGLSEVPPIVHEVLRSPGQPLDSATREFMELCFGHDFSKVRVHSGGAAEQSVREVNANAYTMGHNIVFGEGRFAPGTHEGRRLITHELTHVVQQNRGGTNAPAPLPGSNLEREADRAASTRMDGEELIRVAFGSAPGLARQPRSQAPKPKESKSVSQKSFRSVDITKLSYFELEQEYNTVQQRLLSQTYYPERQADESYLQTIEIEIEKLGKPEQKKPESKQITVVDYYIFSLPNGQLKSGDKWKVLFDNWEQLEQVYLDAASGNPRAKGVVQHLEITWNGIGKGMAEQAYSLQCTVPIIQDFSPCIPNWSKLDFWLRKDKPGSVRLRQVLAGAYEKRSRELGIRNEIISKSLNLVLAGVAVRGALGEAATTKVVGEGKALTGEGKATVTEVAGEEKALTGEGKAIAPSQQPTAKVEPPMKPTRPKTLSTIESPQRLPGTTGTRHLPREFKMPSQGRTSFSSSSEQLGTPEQRAAGRVRVRGERVGEGEVGTKAMEVPKGRSGAREHWEQHGNEFPEYRNARKYEKGAIDFCRDPATRRFYYRHQG